MINLVLQTGLDALLEEEEYRTDHLQPLDLVSKLQIARQQVQDLEYQLSIAKRRLCADLAVAIRKLQPGFNISVDKNSCKIGYKTKILQLSPDIENGIWRVQSSNARFLREFLNTNRRATLLDNPMLPQAITDYFMNYYRSLREDIGGTGVLLIDEQRKTFVDLISWRTQESLPSRLTRRMPRG